MVLISQINFCNKILPVSGSSSVHHRGFSTVHTALVYVIHVSWQLASKLSANPLCISVCTVLDSRRWTEPLSETCRDLLKNKSNIKFDYFEQRTHSVFPDTKCHCMWWNLPVRMYSRKREVSLVWTNSE